MKQRFARMFVAAIAAGLVLASAAAAGDVYHGFGIVGGRDLQSSTLVISGRTFEVTASTTIRDLEGAPLEFATMPIFDIHQGLFSLDDATKVEFHATRGASGQWVLDSVEMVDRLPE